jgi:hypothetical protein
VIKSRCLRLTEHITTIYNYLNILKINLQERNLLEDLFIDRRAISEFISERNVIREDGFI